MKNNLPITLLCLLFTATIFAQSPKRGIAYGYHSKADLLALKPGLSWWYNWSPEPDTDLRADYQSLGVEFVPMVWGKISDGDVQGFINKVKPGANLFTSF